MFPYPYCAFVVSPLRIPIPDRKQIPASTDFYIVSQQSFQLVLVVCSHRILLALKLQLEIFLGQKSICLSRYLLSYSQGVSERRGGNLVKKRPVCKREPLTKPRRIGWSEKLWSSTYHWNRALCDVDENDYCNNDNHDRHHVPVSIFTHLFMFNYINTDFTSTISTPNKSWKLKRKDFRGTKFRQWQKYVIPTHFVKHVHVSFAF